MENHSDASPNKGNQHPSVLISEYLHNLMRAIEELPTYPIQETIDRLAKARDSEHNIFVFGNGGSASTASHMVNDLNRLPSTLHGKRFRAISLVENIALMTALANDTAYEHIFTNQLKNLLRPEDVVIGISTSGNSANIVRALQFAQKNGATTILFSGYSGGKCIDYSDIVIRVPSQTITVQEDLHLVINHILALHFNR